MRAICIASTWNIPRPLKNLRRGALQVLNMDVAETSGTRLRKGQAACIHRSPKQVECLAAPPDCKLCVLTIFRRKRLLGET
ncbi:hypothetical protein [Thermomonas paludicola]|uniref:hypothetical protein n=1 Tax=Thermomonas paludicola TaxID=2884874 RepID=UPI0021154053|nr:hypothetical protein [Thermomonas paludicola]